MQMIDVLKRLAELDAKNPNIIKENSMAEASPYIGDYQLEPPDDKSEWPKLEPSTLSLNVYDPAALDANPDANDWPSIPVTVTYNDLTTNIKNPDCQVAKIVNMNTDQEIKFDDLAGVDQDQILELCHSDLRNRIKNQLSNDDTFESTISEGQNKMTNNINECNPMGGMTPPHTPASINMTANTGEELTGMLRDIMQLAGLKQVGPTDMGHEPEPAVISTPPTISVATVDDQPSMMRSMIDKLNDPSSDEEPSDTGDETPVKETDNAPDEEYVSPQNGPLGVSGPASYDHSGSKRAGKNRHNMNAPVADPGVTFESLMADYRKFVAETSNQLVVKEENPLDLSSDYAYYIVDKGNALIGTFKKLFARANTLPPEQRNKFYKNLENAASSGDLGDIILQYSNTITIDDLLAISDVFDKYGVMLHDIVYPGDITDYEDAWKQYASDVVLAKTNRQPGQTIHEQSAVEQDLTELQSVRNPRKDSMDKAGAAAADAHKAKGGPVTTAPYKGPKPGEKSNYGSRHIGQGKGSRGAQMGTGTVMRPDKPVIGQSKPKK